MADFPGIYLAIDNCFASKRWTRPAEWAQIIRDCGVTWVETSADTECDPMYHGRDYLRRWIDEVGDACETFGCRIANLYSGHGTYATLGLAHTDEGVRDRFQEEWLMPMVDTADALHAGFGFFAHAFPQSVINNGERFMDALDDLYDRFSALATYAQSKPNVKPIGVEQMYSPHQVPWTVYQAHDLVVDVFARGGAPFYLTLDVGHAGGQHRFLKPVSESSDDPVSDAHLVAAEHDCDPYAWLRELAGWSPIIHLQQTDGKSSPHWPFTEEYNDRGIITAPQVLRAIHTHYQRVANGDGAADSARVAPPPVESIYLTIEAFAGTGEQPDDIIQKVKKSAEYWRRYVPEDGLTVDQLVTAAEAMNG